MCGIAGFALTKRSHGSFPVGQFSKHLLCNSDKRGKHATGYVGVIPGQKKPKVAYHKMPVEASEFVKLHTLDRRTQIALLHTRHFTKGDPKQNENNHPVMVNSCFAIHNGSIQNDDDVLVEAGIDKEHRVGEVDSFAVPAALEYHGWGDEADIKLSLHMLKGAFAIAAIDPINKPGKVLLAKGETSPLVVLTTPQGIFWASERKFLEDAWGATLGTPPKQTALDSTEFGWYHFKEGEYWLVDVTSGQLVVRPGRFDVNRAYSYQSTNSAPAWRPYTSEDKAWTCWPNEKNCVFGHDCKNCSNDDCECWSGNPNHPALNEGLKFDELADKWTGFKSLIDKHKIRKGMVQRPIEGVRVLRPHPRSSDNVMSSSSTTGKDTQSKNTSQLSLVKGEGSTLGLADCFYCEKPFIMKDMVELHPVIEGMSEKLYSCQGCANATRSIQSPIGHDPKLRRAINNLMHHDAQVAEEVLEAAVQETAWEFTIPPKVVRYLSMFCPNSALKDDPDLQAFAANVKAAFTANVKVVQELRKHEKADD